MIGEQLSIDMLLCDPCFNGHCYVSEGVDECLCCINHIEGIQDRQYTRFGGGKRAL